MKELFEEYPYLEDEIIILRKMTLNDVSFLKAMTQEKEVYRFLPTFLYELKYDEKDQVIRKMDEECFFNKESILLGIYRKEDPDELAGIAEIYSYKPEKKKASIGYRLRKEYWGRGIATRAAALLKDYILDDRGMSTVTGHVMKENIASAKVLMKNGLINKYPDNWEDWGFDDLVLVDKYVLKRYD